MIILQKITQKRHLLINQEKQNTCWFGFCRIYCKKLFKKVNLILKTPILFILFFLLPSWSIKSQPSFPAELKKAFDTGNSEQLAGYFGKNIELILLDKGDVYSKAQAQLIIQNFFTNNKPENFTVESESTDADINYTIAILQTQKTNYRIFIAYRKNNKKTVVSQMVISELINEED